MSKTEVVAEPGRQDIIITRIFDAPRDLVFKATFDPDLIPQWWGPRWLTTTVDKMDAISGGSWRFVQRDQEGNEYAFNGVFHEIAPPERAIQTFEFEGLPEKGHVALEFARFEELPGGKTKLTTISVFQSVADRDGMIQSDMERGVNESHERLDELLKTLQEKKRR
jgi:uncharacterized protein YndB with AHSA1/START domain